jgi:uncharacterized membrane protein
MLDELQTTPWPGIPKTSSEYVTLIAHYYRAEMSRMSGWRDRIDRAIDAHCSSRRPALCLGWGVVMVIAAFYCWIFYAALRRYAGEGELAIGDVHV